MSKRVAKRNDGEARRELDAAAYNAVVAASELRDISLMHCHFDLEPAYYDAVGKGEALQHMFADEVVAFDFDSDDGVATIGFDWRLEVRTPDADEPVLELVATYLVMYTELAGQDEDAVRAFTSRVGRFATYPYFRALASQMSWAADAPMPIMPVLREGMRRNSDSED